MVLENESEKNSEVDPRECDEVPIKLLKKKIHLLLSNIFLHPYTTSPHFLYAKAGTQSILDGTFNVVTHDLGEPPSHIKILILD
ncbi:hypothetical protein DVH24_018310 [Malus domestica]|uniref:Uncharacterized protein n=1 Tax=Malus domestica TaxID=3750 RepID=A0A498KF65_MALDO|nr:hypothetical protein DVH24_018310 [Malus domestica]